MEEWWQNSLAEDIHANLRQREMHIPVYYSRSPQLAMRRYLVDWLAVICDQYDICTTGRHLAVTLLDFLMDMFVVGENQLQLVALSCLLVAAKFEEREVNIPKAPELNNFAAPPGYALSSYLQMELLLLDTFQWKIGFPTAAHFKDYFHTAAILQSDFHGDQPIMECNKAKMYVAKYVNYFLEISLQDNSYREYKPSQVCAACIASSRACLQISPPWNTALQKLTWYSWKDLEPLTQLMLKTHKVDEQAATKTKSMDCLHELSPSSSNPSTGSPAGCPSTPCTPTYLTAVPSDITMETEIITTTSANTLPCTMLTQIVLPYFVHPVQSLHFQCS